MRRGDLDHTGHVIEITHRPLRRRGDKSDRWGRGCRIGDGGRSQRSDQPVNWRTS